MENAPPGGRGKCEEVTTRGAQRPRETEFPTRDGAERTEGGLGNRDKGSPPGALARGF